MLSLLDNSNSYQLFQMWGGDDDRLGEEYEDEYNEGVEGDVSLKDDVMKKQIVNIKNTVNVAVNNYVNAVNTMKELLPKEKGATTEVVQDVKNGSGVEENLATRLQEAVTDGVDVMKESLEYYNGTTVSDLNKQMVELMEKSKNVSLEVQEQLCVNKVEGTAVHVQIVLILGGVVIGVIMSIIVYFCVKYVR